MQVLSQEDVICWPDGTWCYREELSQMAHKSDDYLVLPADSAEWLTFLRNEEGTA